MVDVGRMLDLYLAEADRPSVIDLTGGQPDLVPEWVPWMMQEIRDRGLESQVYLWSDDNLSNDYFWQYLNREQIDLVANYGSYGRVCCFKGFDDESFEFNTRAAPELFDNQFALFSRLVGLGLDIYAYVTLTTPNGDRVGDKVRRFMDRLQAIDVNLPLRTVPLEVRVFTPVKGRLQDIHGQAIQNQQEAIATWNAELIQRFSPSLRSLLICDVPFSTSTILFDGKALMERSATVRS